MIKARSSIWRSPLGAGTLGPYLLGVELASMLLLAGLIGAYHPGRREETVEPPRGPVVIEKSIVAPSRAMGDGQRSRPTPSPAPQLPEVKAHSEIKGGKS